MGVQWAKEHHERACGDRKSPRAVSQGVAQRSISLPLFLKDPEVAAQEIDRIQYHISIPHAAFPTQSKNDKHV